MIMFKYLFTILSSYVSPLLCNHYLYQDAKDFFTNCGNFCVSVRPIVNETANQQGHALHIQINISKGQQLSLNVHENRKFIGKKIKIKNIILSGEVLKPPSETYHFVGTVNSDKNSWVALSRWNNEIRGIIQYNNTVYFVEPVPYSYEEKIKKHYIYKHSEKIKDDIIQGISNFANYPRTSTTDNTYDWVIIFYTHLGKENIVTNDVINQCLALANIVNDILGRFLKIYLVISEISIRNFPFKVSESQKLFPHITDSVSITDYSDEKYIVQALMNETDKKECFTGYEIEREIYNSAKLNNVSIIEKKSGVSFGLTALSMIQGIAYQLKIPYKTNNKKKQLKINGKDKIKAISWEKCDLPKYLGSTTTTTKHRLHKSRTPVTRASVNNLPTVTIDKGNSNEEGNFWMGLILIISIITILMIIIMMISFVYQRRPKKDESKKSINLNYATPSYTPSFVYQPHESRIQRENLYYEHVYSELTK